MHGTRAPRDYVEDVANRGAARRSDHPDAPGKHRNRALDGLGKQTFSSQACFRLFKSQLQRAGADRLGRFDDQRILALWFVDAETAPRAQLPNSLRAEPQAPIAPAGTSFTESRKRVHQS